MQPTRRSVAPLALLTLFVLLLGGCGREPVGFPYADERYTYPEAGDGAPGLHIGEIRDARPDAQRRGEGGLTAMTYPSDERWERPVTQLYREALTRDLVQTGLAEVVPMPSQADYVLEAEIESFHCRLERSKLGFLAAPALGLLGGFALADDTSGALRRAAVFTILGYGALPVSGQQRAEVVARLTLFDAQGRQVWEQTCVGEVEDSVWESATARPVKKYAERHLPQALKRANACLLGQLRQFLISE